MDDPPAAKRPKELPDGLKALADAYDVSTPTLDAIAEAIIAKTQPSDGEYARGAVIDLLACIIEDPETLTALEKGDKLSNDVLKRMADLVASDPPATVPEWDFLQLVLDDIRSVFAK